MNESPKGDIACSVDEQRTNTREQIVPLLRLLRAHLFVCPQLRANSIICYEFYKINSRASLLSASISFLFLLYTYIAKFERNSFWQLEKKYEKIAENSTFSP